MRSRPKWAVLLSLLVAGLLLSRTAGGAPAGGVHQQALGPVSESPPLVATYNLTRAVAYPLGITTDGSGNVWFAEDNSDSLVEFVTANSTFKSFPIPTISHLEWIWFLIVDSNGNIWFSDESQSLIWKFDPATNAFSNYTAGGAFPMVLAYDEIRDRIWFTSLETNQVGYFDISGGSAELGGLTNISSALPGAGVAGIQVDPTGDVFVAESFQAKIIEFSGSTLSVVKTWTLPKGSQPVGLALDEARGRLWFTNHASSFFGYVNLNSTGYTEYPTSLLPEGDSYTVTLPYWIGLSSSGEIWLNEHFANKIARFNPDTLQLTEFDIPTSNSSPLRFTIDDAQGMVWFTEFEGNAIGSVDENSSMSQTVTVSPSATKATPSSMVRATPDPLGSLDSVSINSSITGEPSPVFNVTSQQSGSGYSISITANDTKPGDYASAICFNYPGFSQCGYVSITVPGQPYASLAVYGTSGVLGALAVALAFKIRRDSRRQKNAAAPGAYSPSSATGGP